MNQNSSSNHRIMSEFEDIENHTKEINHDRLSIDTPGSIQPHGILLVIDRNLKIVQVSQNTQIHLDKSPQDLLRKSLSSILQKQQIKEIQQSIATKKEGKSHLKLSIKTFDREKYFDLCIYRVRDNIILELEPTESLTEMSFSNFHSLVSEALFKMQKTANLVELLDLVASEIRAIIEIDRVMVYQFDARGSGCVLAESKREDLSSYLGLHYPATDIPEESRDLYTRFPLRYIPDLSVELVSIVPTHNPQTSLPLDLTHSTLRSFDSCCREFHQNMGIAALVVIPLIENDRLWGLISCHHQTPKYLPYPIRTTCEFLGQIVSRELNSKLSYEEFDYKIKLQSIQSELIESIASAKNFLDALIEPAIRLLDLTSATGAAVCLGDDIQILGKTPSIEEIRSLIEWTDRQINESLFSTDSLPKLYPEAEAFKDAASGLLMLRISKVKRYYILWFRSEVIQTVNWAGNPQDSFKIDADGNLILCPRNSFKLWQETVRSTSLPWQQWELDRAVALRNAIVGIVLSKAEELAKINLELERSNRELASFAYAASHDLKEPLRGIYNYSTILLEDYETVLDEEGVEYLQSLISLSQRMDILIDVLLKFSQIGQAELNLQPTDLNESIAYAIDVFRASRQNARLDVRIPRPLPILSCDSTLINEVFSNLIINAFKYNDNLDKLVEIGYKDEERPIFYVRDNGIGIQNHHLETIFRLFKRLHSQEKYGGGAGAGLAITKKIIEHHGGQIWAESTYGKGSTFFFYLNKL
jgi:chemotaxis family two-component system sensor kinase Cph1